MGRAGSADDRPLQQKGCALPVSRRAACRPSRDVGGSRRGIFGWAPLRWLAERVLCLPASEAEAERTVAHGRDSGLQMAAIIAGLCCRERLNHGLRHSPSGTPPGWHLSLRDSQIQWWMLFVPKHVTLRVCNVFWRDHSLGWIGQRDEADRAKTALSACAARWGMPDLRQTQPSLVVTTGG